MPIIGAIDAICAHQMGETPLQGIIAILVIPGVKGASGAPCSRANRAASKTNLSTGNCLRSDSACVVTLDEERLDHLGSFDRFASLTLPPQSLHVRVLAAPSSCENARPDPQQMHQCRPSLYPQRPPVTSRR